MNGRNQTRDNGRRNPRLLLPHLTHATQSTQSTYSNPDPFIVTRTSEALSAVPVL